MRSSNRDRQRSRGRSDVIHGAGREVCSHDRMRRIQVKGVLKQRQRTRGRGCRACVHTLVQRHRSQGFVPVLEPDSARRGSSVGCRSARGHAGDRGHRRHQNHGVIRRRGVRIGRHQRRHRRHASDDHRWRSTREACRVEGTVAAIGRIKGMRTAGEVGAAEAGEAFRIHGQNRYLLPVIGQGDKARCGRRVVRVVGVVNEERKVHVRAVSHCLPGEERYRIVALVSGLYDQLGWYRGDCHRNRGCGRCVVRVPAIPRDDGVTPARQQAPDARIRGLAIRQRQRQNALRRIRRARDGDLNIFIIGSSGASRYRHVQLHRSVMLEAGDGLCTLCQ